MNAVQLCLSSDARGALGRLRTALEERFGARLRELVLFGSFARGDANEESDVDVLVVIDALSPEEKISVLELTYRTAIGEDREWCPILPLVLSTADARFLRERERLIMQEIDRDGVAL